MGARHLNRIGSLLAGTLFGIYAGATPADVVPVVSAKTPVVALSKNQLADIFLGKAVRFPDGRPAVPIDQAEGTATREEFYLVFAGKSPAQLNAHWSKVIFTGRGQPPREFANSSQVKKRLGEDPGTIGYIEQEAVDASVRVVPVQ